jgi:hypothetical protein
MTIRKTPEQHKNLNTYLAAEPNDDLRMMSNHKGLFVALTITFAVYIPSLFSYFQQDDWGHLVTVSQPGFNPWSFGHWFYRPLFLAAFGGLYKAFGLNATAWHIVELLLHMVNVVLVYYLIKRLKFSRIGATAGALAFGVFPLSTNAVAWLSAISGVGSATLCLVAAHIALSDCIPVLLRGVLCAVIWAPALFLKEESASMILVLPFLPMFTKTKRSRREWAAWFASCMLMIGALAFFVHMEGQCQHTLGNANACVSLGLLRRVATFVLWPTSMGLPIFAASEIWILAILALFPVTLWVMYPSLRPGLFWLIATGLAIGVALKFLAPAGRYFYIPSVGICLCVAALVQRLFLINRPFPFADRFIAALLVVWVVSIGSLPSAVAIAAGLVVLFWRSVSDQKDALDRGRAIAALATACAFTLLENLSVSLTGIGYFPFYLTMILPLIITAIFLAGDWSQGRRPINWHVCVLFPCLAFWTQQPTVCIFLLALILARFIENKKPKLFVKHIGAWAGLLAAAVITLPWAVSSLERNLTWLESGQRIRSATSMTAHLMSRLPKGSRVAFVDNAGFTFPEPRILQVTSGLIAHRPDLSIRQSKKIDPRVYNIVCDSRWLIRLYPPDN